ncbi:hypothetical protein Pcinc_030255 [Petrolisthes cinctipes]|uniref:MRH domain-containing protein n=1 Tax=Petrolisthes cinctipes TaxID=88211 RepID=A0AAE1K6A3_PETCI|nr:hypothetical protein Pcinc_030255 [Petrolisthes cinctipes]
MACQGDNVKMLMWMLSWMLTMMVVAGLVPMKVLDDLPSGGYGNIQDTDGRMEEKMVLRMKPANYSGPHHLMDWRGKCFKHRDSKYEYVFCPFHNITQEDILAYYDAYKGVLGVWSDWEIQNNQFQAMNMVEGSPCANDTYRSTKVYLKCGKESELVSVTEPNKCRYQAVFMSPEVCGVNAMVVYPRLPTNLQVRWDQAVNDHSLGYITQKGYDKELRRIFTAAGLILSPEVLSTLKQKASVEKSKSCQSDLEAARARIIELEELLRVKQEVIRELHDARADM